MLFNSYTFILFFVVVLLTTRCIGHWGTRKAFLLGCSYLFYAAWNPPFLILLWISTLADYVIAGRLHRTGSPRGRKALVAASLAVNLGMLGFFKYGDFLLETFNALAGPLGFAVTPRESSIVLPVGISFYTFQSISYTLDVYRGRLKPWRSLGDFALFVTFFPQLIAGPIVRAGTFLPQCAAPRKGSARQVGWGLYLFVLGLFSKVVLADELMAPVVEHVFDHTVGPVFLEGWTGIFAFSMQIFYDFFGYSTCAVGLALCLGFELPDNFRCPYAARGFVDFWRRWHITLSTWLRDYLFLPLAGKRSGPMRILVALMLTMVLGGLWHGASWLFAIWGGLFGVYLVIERSLRGTRLAALAFWRTPGGRLLLTLFTYWLVCTTGIFFRGRELGLVMPMLFNLFDLKSGFTIPPGEQVGLEPVNYVLVVVLVVATFTVQYRTRELSIEEVAGRLPWAVNGLALAVMLYGILISMTGEDNAFIYFQF